MSNLRVSSGIEDGKAKVDIAPDLTPFLTEALQHLVYDLPLSEQYRDYALAGNWSDHRDCPLKPDLILIYRKIDDDVLCSWCASVLTANWGC